MTCTQPPSTRICILTRRDVVRIEELLRSVADAIHALLESCGVPLTAEADRSLDDVVYEQTSEIMLMRDRELMLDELF